VIWCRVLSVCHVGKGGPPRHGSAIWCRVFCFILFCRSRFVGQAGIYVPLSVATAASWLVAAILVDRVRLNLMLGMTLLLATVALAGARFLTYYWMAGT